MFNWFFSSFFFDLAQAVTNGDPLQAYASMQPYAGIGKFWNMTVLIKFKKNRNPWWWSEINICI